MDMQKSSKMIIEGNYMNANMYIQNPYTTKDSGFCVTKCTVNGKAIDSIGNSAFEIPLTTMGFKEGDSIKIEIWHHDDCKPKTIYNPPAPKKPVEFTDVTVDSNYVLHFKTKGEAYKYTYIIEQYRWNKWVRIGEVEAKAIYSGAEYSFQITPHSGENMVRVKLLSPSNIPTMSKAVKFTSKGYTCCDGYNKVQGKIVFSGETLYEVYNKEGQIIKKGFAAEIDISDLSPDVYYLNYDNKTTEFVVKKKKN